MPYGTLKCDNIVFTNSGVDQTIGVSGLVQSVSGNLTATGTISGNLIRGNTVSGATITGSVLSVTSGLFTSGTVSAPTIGFAGDGNTGFWTPAGDVVALSTGGSERLRVDADGDLGVGTTDPTSRLTVRADAASGPNTIIRVENKAASAGATTQNIKIEGIFDYNNGTSDASAGAILFGKEGTYTTATTANDSYLAFETVTDNSSTEKLRINSTGQLITTISGTAAAPAVVLGNDINSGLYSPGADQVAISTGGTGRLFVDASGNIGVDVASPTRQIDIATSDTTAGLGWTVRLRANATAAASAIQWTTSNAGQTNGYIACDTARSIYLGSGSTERLRIDVLGTTTLTSNANTAPFIAKISTTEVARIDSSGRLLVGVSANISAFGSGLQLVGSGAEATQLIMRNTTAVGGPQFYFVKSRGSDASPVVVIADDQLGLIDFRGYSATGAAYLQAASIQAFVDGTPDSGGDTTDMPGRLVFSTTADGSNIPTERLRITSTGNVGIGTSAPAGALDVAVGGFGPARVIMGQTSDNPHIDLYRNTGIGSNFAGFRLSTPSTNGELAFSNATSNTIGSHSFTERVRIDLSGKLLVGTPAARSNFAGNTTTPLFQVEGVSSATTNSSVVRNSVDAFGPTFNFGKTRGASVGQNTVVASGDQCGVITFQGADGTNLRRAAEISAAVDGTPGADDMPGRLVFSTTADGAATPTERMRIDSAGNVGIGTSSYSNALVVSRGAGVASYAEFVGNGSPASSLLVGQDASGLSRIFQVGANPFTIWTNSLERLRITSTGNVGIGTSSPGQALDVVGIINSQGNATTLVHYQAQDTGAAANENTWRIAQTLRTPKSLALGVTVNDAGSTAYAPITIVRSGVSLDNIQFATGTGTERARIDSSGRLLVGTSTTSQTTTVLLQGNSNTSAGNAALYLARGSATPADGNGLGQISFSDSGHVSAVNIIAARDGGTWTSGTSQPSRLVFSTTADGASSPTEHLRIRSSGDLLWGNGSLPTASNSGIVFTNKTYPYIEMASATDTSARYKITFLNGNGMVGRIETSGSSTSYITTSDYRLKENVIPVTDGITRLQQLNPSRFNFIAEPSKTVDGFLAHEVQTVVPEAISGEKDAVDADGKPVYQGIDQSKLVPLLTAALQEAITRIETLEARITTLEAN